jgi:hypothetical protein
MQWGDGRGRLGRIFGWLPRIWQLRMVRAVWAVLKIAGKLLGIALFLWGMGECTWETLKYLGHFGQRPWDPQRWGIVLHHYWPAAFAWMAGLPDWLRESVVRWLLYGPAWLVNMGLGAVIYLLTPARTPWLYVLMLYYLQRQIGTKRR